MELDLWANGGQLHEYKRNAESTTLGCKVNVPLLMREFRNSTGAVLPSTNNNIQLACNQTAFKGNADTNNNCMPTFNSVHAALYIMDSILANLSLDPSKSAG